MQTLHWNDELAIHVFKCCNSWSQVAHPCQHLNTTTSCLNLSFGNKPFIYFYIFIYHLFYSLIYLPFIGSSQQKLFTVNPYIEKGVVDETKRCTSEIQKEVLCTSGTFHLSRSPNRLLNLNSNLCTARTAIGSKPVVLDLRIPQIRFSTSCSS